MPKHTTLAREQEIVVQAARCALTRTIEQYSPIGTDTLPITTVAISRMFADPASLRQPRHFAITVAVRVGGGTIALKRQNPLRKRNNLELSWLEPRSWPTLDPPRRNFAVRIEVGNGTGASREPSRVRNGGTGPSPTRVGATGLRRKQSPAG